MGGSANILQRCWDDRLRRLRALLAGMGMDGVLVVDPNIRSWIGRVDVAQALVTADAVITAGAKGLAAQLNDGRGLTLGFDSSLTAAELVRLQDAVPWARWRPLGPPLDRLLAVKDEIEIVLLRKAARLTRRVFERLESAIGEGRSELELLHLAHETMLEAGGDGFSFDPSIAGGARSSLVWAGVSMRRLRRGEPVLVDLGVSYRGYQCDMARSYIVDGGADGDGREWATALRAVEEALARVCEHVRPGAHCHELHALCERMLERAGYGGRMQHYLGHGVGFRVHEPPFLAPESRDVLVEGMVIALEPGVVLGADAGFRREDVVVVTSTGCESLTG